MEPHAVIYPPNRPMEKVNTSLNVPVMYDYLLFIDFNNKGEVILGSSNIAGTYWNGTLFYYKEPKYALSGEYSGYYITDASIADGKCIEGTNFVLIAEDNLYLKLLSLPENNNNIQCHDYYKNRDRIEQISLGKNANKFAYTCSGNAVTIWDLENNSKISLLEDYRNYHTDVVTSVDTSYHDINLFASTSVDRKACVWDDRLSVPASVLYVNEFCSLTSIAWHPSYSNLLTIGTAAGDVYLVDKREPKEFITVNHCFENKIHRLAFNKAVHLAVCGDVCNVQVLNCSNTSLTNIYSGCEHTNTVRDVAWFNDTLYSCGFDKKVVKYAVYGG